MDLFLAQAVSITLLGLAVGSFLNVCISRIPKGESIIFPPSHCPSCGTGLKYFDLIPVFSFMFLKGKCRYCNKNISARYPLVELVSAILYLSLLLKYGLSLELLFSGIFASALIVIFFTDLETHTIHDGMNAAAGSAGFMSSVFSGTMISSLAGAFAGGIIIWGIRAIGGIVYKREVIGEGDIWLASALGAYLGWKDLLLAFFFSFTGAAVFYGFLVVFRFRKKEDEIPFGPALVIAAVVVMFFADKIWKWYLV